MPKVSEEHKSAIREQILDAALNCFVRKGYQKTSMRDIFKEANLSAGAVYLHFKSKEEIMEAVFKRNQEERELRYTKYQKMLSTMEGRQEYSEYYLRKLGEPVADKTWQLWAQLVSEGIQNPLIKKNILEGWDLIERQVEDIHNQRVEREEVDNTDTEYKAFARLWTAVHDGLILQKVIDPKQDVRRYAEFFYKLYELYEQTNLAKPKD